MLKSINREGREPIILHPGRSGSHWMYGSSTEPPEKLFQQIPHYRREEIKVKESGRSLAGSLIDAPQEPNITPFISSPHPPIDLSSSPSKSVASGSVAANSTAQKRKLFMTCIKHREDEPITSFSIPQPPHKNPSGQ
jgi:hypothetical protein